MNDERCCQCSNPRRTISRAAAKFTFIDIVDVLKSKWCDKDYAQMVRTYLSSVKNQDIYKSVHNGLLINSLRNRRIVIDGEEQDNYYFEDFREGALSLCIDGVGIFKRQKRQVWPIIIVDHSLPPEIRHKKEFVTFLCVFPG